METHGSPSSNWTGLCAPVGVAGRGVVETRPTVFTELVVLGVTGTELVDELVTVGVSVVLVGVGVSVVLVDVSAVLVGVFVVLVGVSVVLVGVSVVLVGVSVV